MLSNTATFRKFKFDGKGFRREYSEQLYQLFIDACQAWVEAVLTAVNGSFPVWTGMAKASLVPLAEYLQVESVEPFSLDLSISPKPGSEWHQQNGQNIAAGLAANKFKITRLVTPSNNGPLPSGFNFYYTNLVPHYEINESNAVPTVPSSPWYTFSAGQAAFEEYIRDNYDRYVPVMTDYFSLGSKE